ncbi:MAG: carboxypeptidase regulatory-like domain-containing protein, partial [Mariprofundales bacterium]
MRYISPLVFMFLLMIPIAGLAATPTGWLANQSDSYGMYSTPPDIATPSQATATALQTFLLSSHPYDPYAITTLTSAPYQTTQSLSYLISIYTQINQDSYSLINSLLLHCNRDGGFGEKAGYSSTILDTALALQALNEANMPLGDETGLAVMFLLSKQNATTGGWADGDNISDVYLSALAMRALLPYRNNLMGVDNVLVNAQNYLLTQRDIMGLWPETYQTAMSLLALIPALSPDLSSITMSMSSLGNEQWIDGNWNGSVFDTALATQVLQYEQQPPVGLSVAKLQGLVSDIQTTMLLAGVQIDIYGSSIASVVTDSYGSFIIDNLLPGSYNLNISAPGYANMTTSILAVAGEIVDMGIVSMLQTINNNTGNVLGVVTDSITGIGIADVYVTAGNVSSYTNINGEYQLNQVLPGAIVISTYVYGYAPVNSSVNLIAGNIIQYSPSLSVIEIAITSLSGLITDASNGSGLLGVTVTASGTTVLTTITDTYGAYKFSTIQPGNYVLNASALSYDTVTANAAIYEFQKVDFSPSMYSQNTTPIGVNMASITGIVMDAGSNQSLSGVNV